MMRIVVANTMDPMRTRPSGPAEADTGWRGWLITALLVFIGVSLAGVVAAVLNPRPQRPSAEAEVAKEAVQSPAPKAQRPKPAGVDAAPSQAHRLRPVGTQPAEANAAEKVPPAAPIRPAQPAGVDGVPPDAHGPKPAETHPVDKVLPAAPTRPAQAAEAAANVAPADAKQKQEPKPAAPPEDAAKRAAYAKAVAQTRLAFWQRDMAAAHKHLKMARKNAQSPADDAESERLETIADHLDQFWNALRDEVAKLTPGDELEIKGNRVAIVEASRNELLIHIFGRQQRYRIEALPVAVIRTLVNRSFSHTPGSKVVLGTFLAMDKEGDRARARLLWEDAAKQGESLGHDLLPELDVPPPAGRVGNK